MLFDRNGKGQSANIRTAKNKIGSFFLPSNACKLSFGSRFINFSSEIFPDIRFFESPNDSDIEQLKAGLLLARKSFESINP